MLKGALSYKDLLGMGVAAGTTGLVGGWLIGPTMALARGVAGGDLESLAEGGISGTAGGAALGIVTGALEKNPSWANLTNAARYRRAKPFRYAETLGLLGLGGYNIAKGLQHRRDLREKRESALAKNAAANMVCSTVLTKLATRTWSSRASRETVEDVVDNVVDNAPRRYPWLKGVGLAALTGGSILGGAILGERINESLRKRSNR